MSWFTPFRTRAERGDFRRKGNAWRRDHYRPGYKPRLTIAAAHAAADDMVDGVGQCDHCGGRIVRYRRTKRFCSGACRAAAHRAR
jgi:hypothetical protein